MQIINPALNLSNLTSVEYRTVKRNPFTQSTNKFYCCQVFSTKPPINDLVIFNEKVTFLISQRINID